MLHFSNLLLIYFYKYKYTFFLKKSVYLICHSQFESKYFDYFTSLPILFVKYRFKIENIINAFHLNLVILLIF